MLGNKIRSDDKERTRPTEDRRILADQRCQCFLPNRHPCPALRRLSMPSAFRLQQPVASAAPDDAQKRKETTPESRTGRPRQRLQGTGFVILAEVPNEELVIGVAERFWRPDGGRCLDLAADGFGEFSRSGYAKAAWNFKLRPESPERTVLSTETRIKCLGWEALWKFRPYWSLVSPFSGLIRRAILKQVKVESESTSGMAASERNR